MSKNILKKKRMRKDYERKRNIRITEARQIRKRTRKDFSINYPKSRKYKIEE